MRRALALAVSVPCLLATRALPAQRHSDLDRADSLLAAGRVLAAESIYYEAARQRPRDPNARRHLGRYLAARGALRIAAVLLEEARFFGADARTVAIELSPVYAALGDYKALASLSLAPLTTAERRRAEWLATNPSVIELADSASVPLTPLERDGVGEIPMVIDGDTLIATIDPATNGLVLDTTWARRRSARLFGSSADPRRASGVVQALSIGTAALRRVPARYTPMPRRRARVGMDIVALLLPTFDEKGRQLVIRAPRTKVRGVGDRFLTVTTLGGMLLASAETAVAIDSPSARAVLSGRRWTWIPRLGEVWVER